MPFTLPQADGTRSLLLREGFTHSTYMVNEISTDSGPVESISQAGIALFFPQTEVLVQKGEGSGTDFRTQKVFLNPLFAFRHSVFIADKL